MISLQVHQAGKIKMLDNEIICPDTKCQKLPFVQVGEKLHFGKQFHIT